MPNEILSDLCQLDRVVGQSLFLKQFEIHWRKFELLAKYGPPKTKWLGVDSFRHGGPMYVEYWELDDGTVESFARY